MQATRRRETRNPFDGAREVIATIKDRVIVARINAQREDDAMTVALRDYLRAGMSIDDLSAESGLSPAEIRHRVDAINTSGSLN